MPCVRLATIAFSPSSYTPTPPTHRQRPIKVWFFSGVCSRDVTCVCAATRGQCPAMTEQNPQGTSQATSTETANSESFLPQSTVLIVDDNPQNVELLQAFLEALPVKIVTAFDGIEALDKVVEHKPDLILLDIMMPRMSGFQVCRKLKG